MNTIIATGKSGRKYEFTVSKFNLPVSKEAGVYLFLKQTGDSYYPIYIGQTHSFYERIYFYLDQHNAFECIRRNGATHVGVCRIYGSEQQRIDVETDLRNNYTTRCNLQ